MSSSLEVWNSGAFTGSYRQFHQAILGKMPPTQTPNYFKVGADRADFDAQRPFTIDVSNSGSATQGSSATPGVSGPATLNRDSDSAPIFNVNRAGAPYYIFEIASDASLFSNQNARTSSNFYGSYNDPGEPSRLTSASFTLPDPAWQNLKSADTLYYRIGTTTSQTGWDNYTASTTDDQASSAPSIAVSGAKSVPVETYAAKAA